MRSGDSWVLEQEETFEVWVSVGLREATYRRQPSLPSVWKRLGQRQAVMLREGEGRFFISRQCWESISVLFCHTWWEWNGEKDSLGPGSNVLQI